MRSAVFFDIDNTIWDWDHVLPDSVWEALELLQKNGHLAFFNTGRSRAHIEDEPLMKLPLNGAVCACGNYIEYEGRVLYERVMTKDELSLVFRIAKEERMPYVLEGSSYLWMNKEEFHGDAYVERLWTNLGPRAKRLEERTDEDRVNKFSVSIPDHTDFERVKREFREILTPLDHGTKVCEFIPKGSGKAKGIAFLCEEFQIPLENTYAIGDSVNDLDMLSYAGCGICMGNGTKEAKEASDIVTRDLHDDGIYHALKQVGLI